MPAKSFKWGDLVTIAESAGISRGFLNNILMGRRNCKPDLAQLLEAAATKLGYATTWWDWSYPQETSNKLFESYQRGKKWEKQTRED